MDRKSFLWLVRFSLFLFIIGLGFAWFIANRYDKSKLELQKQPEEKSAQEDLGIKLPSNSAIKIALLKEEEHNLLLKETRELFGEGNYAHWSGPGEKEFRVVRRARNNPKLKAVLLEARKSRVKVIFSDRFLTYEGSIVVDEKASDQEIIDFIIGTDSKPKYQARRTQCRQGPCSRSDL